jgi:hypothetical protein
MVTGRKRWDVPCLVVLVRGQPEETVLNSCKSNALSGGPESNNQGCGWIGASCKSCQPRSGGAS